MCWRNVELSFDVGYQHRVRAKRIVAVEQQKLPPQSESLIRARIEGDCKENPLWIVEQAKIQTDFLSAKALVKSTVQRIVPVRVINLSGHEKVIYKNSEVGQCAPVETVINNEQPPNLPKCQAKIKKNLVRIWKNG